MGAEPKVAGLPRVVVVPRWSGGPSSDWYPWLKQQFDRVETGDNLDAADVFVAEMPSPNEPVVEDWVSHLIGVLGAEDATLARTLLVGHSVGCQAVVRALARLAPGQSVAGVLCVAGWFTVDAPWASLRPWIETPVDPARARQAADRCVVMLSDNDPFTSDVVANRQRWEAAMGATVYVIPGAGHFNQASSPAIWEVMQRHFGELFGRPNGETQ